MHLKGRTVSRREEGRKEVDVYCQTDESFWTATHEEHNHGLSQFALLPTDMVDTFPIDNMHQASWCSH